MTNITIRAAVERDAAALARLAEHTFRAAFETMNSAEDMDSYCASAFGEALQRREILDPQKATYLAAQSGDLVGYGQLHWQPPPVAVEARRPVELKRLYVDPGWHGRGVAQALTDALFADARRGDADGMWLGVWEHNPRAIAFYRKSGFEEIGDQVFQLGSDPQRDLLLMRPID